MNKYKGKKVLIVGFGISGVAAAKYFSCQDAKIFVTDIKPREDFLVSIELCANLKIEYEFGKHSTSLFQTADLIVVSPGVPLAMKPLEEAKRLGIPIVNDVVLALESIKEPIIAITGTNGKTTTSTLISEMLKADGKSVFLGGNIGKSLLDYVLEGIKVDFVVVELSSFQLELLSYIKTVVSVFTNIEQDHLDHYGSMESYILAKKKLLQLSSPETFVVINDDDQSLSSFKNEGFGRLLIFKRQNPKQSGLSEFVGAFLNQELRQVFCNVGSKKGESYDLTNFRLLGVHNKENFMAAVCAAKAVGVATDSIKIVIQNFKGVPHRLEFVRKKEGVYFFNDSKGTNVTSVQRSISSFQSNPIILIAGGRDKGSDFSPLVELVRKKCKVLILIGEAKEKLNRVLGDYAETYIVGTFEEAILLSYQKSRNGDVVLFSPACSSYDMFKNYEERGDRFKQLVLQL